MYTGDLDVQQSENQGSAKYADDMLFWCSNAELYAELELKDAIEQQINKTKDKYEATKETQCNDW